MAWGVDREKRWREGKGRKKVLGRGMHSSHDPPSDFAQDE